jgi:flotillin
MTTLIVWPFWIILAIIFIIIAVNLRKVVPTNEVHILQRWSTTIIKGKGFEWWNVYYAWPQWVPGLGISVTKLPLYVFDIKLSNYQAYDNGKIPFVVDVTAFFVIKDPELAAKRVADFEELKEQLIEVVRWAVRKTLAQYDIQEIMEARWELGQKFYEEVTNAVKEWWVELKNIEFMDISDADGYQVIRNLLEKKRKTIETESEKEVALKDKEREIVEAEAKKEAEIKRIEAEKEAKLAQIEADKLTRTQEVEKEKLIKIQEEEAKKQLYEKQKETKQKELDIKLLEEQKEAEIQKVKEIIDAEKQKEIEVKEAEAKAKAIELDAEAKARAMELEAEAKKNAIEKEWLAKAKTIDYVGTAEAKNKLEMAKALNAFSQEALKYLLAEMEYKYTSKVDLEKAKALEKADIKVISTWANWEEGINSFMDLFSSKWWTNLWAMIEAFKNTVGEEKFNEIKEKVLAKK